MFFFLNTLIRKNMERIDRKA